MLGNRKKITKANLVKMSLFYFKKMEIRGKEEP